MNEKYEYKAPVDFVGLDEVAETDQGTINGFVAQVSQGRGFEMGLATVNQVFADRNTCELTTWNGVKAYNVPLLAKAYLKDGKIFGEFEMPVKGSLVVVAFVGGQQSQPFILGTIIPYLYPQFQTAQVPVNSAGKTYTKKLFEAGKETIYRKIFQSGTTIEVQDDGSIIVETPSGTLFQIDEGAVKKINIKDSFVNTIVMDTAGILMNGNLMVKR